MEDPSIGPRIDPGIERIRERAYALWEQEGRPSGREERHWHQAIVELAADDAYALEPKTVRKMRKAASDRRRRGAIEKAALDGLPARAGEIT